MAKQVKAVKKQKTVAVRAGKLCVNGLMYLTVKNKQGRVLVPIEKNIEKQIDVTWELESEVLTINE